MVLDPPAEWECDPDTCPTDERRSKRLVGVVLLASVTEHLAAGVAQPPHGTTPPTTRP